MNRRVAITLTFALVVVATPLLAATLVVDQSGAGDYTTIAAAVGAASDGDQISIRPGVYDEYVNLTKSLDFMAEGGLGTVIWSGGNTHQMLNIEAAVACQCDGIVFANGRVDGVSAVGVAVHVGMGASATFTNCRFQNNWAGWDCALSAQGSGTNVTVVDCEFIDNYAVHNSAAAGVLLYATMSMENCRFQGNTAGVLAGAVAAYSYASLSLSHCVFTDNEGGEAGALRYYAAVGNTSNCTFHDNGGQAVVTILYSDLVSFTNNIVTTNDRGYGLRIEECAPTHSCNIYYDMAGASVSGDDLSVGEMETDPMYCNHLAGDLTLCVLSPALPQNNNCGLIGALEQGCSDCGPIPNEDMTWGGLKNMYR